MRCRGWRGLLISLVGLSSSLLVAPPVTALTASQYRELGLSYRQQERYAEAIAAFQQAVRLEPQNLNGQVNLGWTQHLAGQDTAAAESLLAAGYRHPFYPPAFNALGIVYLVQGELMSAVLTHLWASVLKTDNEIAYYNLSLAYHRLQQYDPAIQTAIAAAKLEPSNPHPLVALAIAYWDQGNRQAAETAYRQAIQVDGRYSDRGFLDYLREAAFSRPQIQTAKTVLAATQGR